MLEIVRGRTWEQYHTFEDTPGVPTDFTDVALVCQIRKAVATRNAAGVFEHALVADVTVSVADNVTKWSLTREQTEALSPTEKYQIDMIGTTILGDFSFINPEPIKVVNRPSTPATP